MPRQAGAWARLHVAPRWGTDARCVTSGAPAVGTCLNHVYRYYRCRSTWPTATRPKTCNAPYIDADRLEEAVWNTVREILQKPDIVIAEIKRQQDESSFIEEEMARVRASIRRLADQERRLIRLFGLGQVTEEYVVREADLDEHGHGRPACTWIQAIEISPRGQRWHARSGCA